MTDQSRGGGAWGAGEARADPTAAAVGLGRVAARVRAGAGEVWADPSWRLALALTLSLRIVAQAVLLVGAAVHGDGRPAGQYTSDVGPHDALWPLVGPWQRWDSLWFEHIARAGYPAGQPDVAFFPLYPGLVHITHALVGGSIWLSMLLVPTIALVPALVLLHRLLSADLGSRAATTATVALCCFPTAFFLVAPYTESLFLLTSVAAFLAMRRRRWLLAALWLGLAAAVRPQGALLLAPLAVEGGAWLLRRHRDGERLLSSRVVPLLVAAATPLVVTAGWYACSRFVVGTPGGFLGAENRRWGATSAAPWTTLINSWHVIQHWDKRQELLNLLCLALALGAAAAMAAAAARRRLPWSYVAYAAASPVPMLLRGSGGTPLQSMSRYALVVFPLFALLAVSRFPRRVLVPLLVCSAVLGAFLLDRSSHFVFVA